MFKKLAFTGVAAAIAAFILFGTSAFTHVSQGVGWVRGQVDENVPVEYKLDKARKAIKTAAPKIRQYNRDIAEKQVEIRYLERELGQLHQDRLSARMILEQQGKALKVTGASYRFQGQTVSKKRMKKDAMRRLRALKAADQLISSKTERLDALKSGLDHIHEALANLTSKREELITMCDVLEAKMRETEAKKASTLDIEIDHSDMARAADILSKVEKQLDVEMQVMENNRPLIGERSTTLETPIDLDAQISAYLEGQSEEASFESECEEDVVETSGTLQLTEIR